jgi:Glycosyl transferase family 11
MLIVLEGAGNHSNRLFQNLHFEALCLEHGYRYYNPTLNDICVFYNRAPFHLNKTYEKAIRYLIRKNVLKTIDFNAEQEATQKGEWMNSMLAKRKIIAVKGWYYWNSLLTKKHREHFQNKYQLKKDLIIKINLFKEYENYDLILGVHIRRGDYKEWLDGKYYYDDDVYLQAVKRFIDKNSYKKILCIFFSDEKLNEDYFLNEVRTSAVKFSTEPWYADHFLMSKCNYLLGPPSTFTMWASFIGTAAYHHIQSKDDLFTMSDFTICTG